MNTRRHPVVFAVLGATVTLALIASLTAVLLAVGITPATNTPGAQERAGASLSAAPTRARAIASESSCTRPGSTARSAGIAVGFCVAAKGGSKFIGPVRQSSHQIGSGHAYGKHVVERGEFPGISSPDEFARHIEGVVSNPTASKGLSNGRSAFYDARSNTVVIRDPRSPDGGTAFRPSAGQSYYDGLR